MSLEIGDRIDGKYEIVRLLGEGGMGAVYEGINTRIHRRVAIKVLHAAVASNDEAMKRFEREAQAAGRIGSEHIVEVLDLGDLPGGERYMVMEFLDGEPLSARISRGRMAPRDIATLMADVLEGLEAAHQAGIIHRDLKPDNVFLLTKGDFAKIVDFGISKFNAMGGEFSMTRTGAVMGTPYYMAPEQAKGGKDVDHRVDVYAAGVILYQAVVGEVPFDAGTFNELLFKIVLETPPNIPDIVPGVDPAFVSIVQRAMARDLNERFASAAALRAALTAWLGGNFIPAGRTVSAGTPLMSGMTSAGPGGSDPGAQMKTSSGGGSNSDDTINVDFVKGRTFKKRALPFVLGAIVMLLAGVSFMFNRTSAVQDDLTPGALPVDPNLGAERDAAVAELEQEREKAIDARKAAEAAQQEAARNQAAFDAQVSERLAVQANQAAQAKKTTARAPKTTQPSSTPKPATPPPKPAATPTSAGRPIRTDL